MATTLWEQEIDKSVDWGGDSSTGGAAVSGQYVQKFIKDTLAKKFGFLHYDRDALKYLVFADEEDYNKYANDTTGEFASLLLATFDAPAPASITIEDTSAQRITILSTEKNQSISFKYIVKDSGNNPITESIQARFMFNNAGTIQTVTQVYDVDFDNYKTGTTQSFVIDNYLTVGTNNITVTLTGISTQATTTITFVYTVVELSLSSEFDNKEAIVYDVAKGTMENNFIVPYVISGQGEKYMEWYINGKPLNQDWVNKIYPELQALSTTETEGFLASKNAVQSSNMVIYLTDQLGKLNNLFVEGKNTLQFRMYINDTNGERIYSITKYYEFVILSNQSTENITCILYSQDLNAGSKFELTDTVSFTTQQYSSTSFKYGLFSTSGAAVNLNFDLTKTDGGNTEKIATLVRSIISGEEQLFEYTFLNYGAIDLVITTSMTDASGKPLDTLHIIINVAKSSVQIEALNSDLLLKLEAMNRSNSEPNPAVWNYKNIDVQFNNVLWNSASGWDGKTLVLNNGANIFIPLNIFDNYTTATGLTFEIEFETVNVQDENATILSFEDTENTLNKSKFVITACGAETSDNSGLTDKGKLSTNFADNTRVKLAVVYNPYSQNPLTSTADYPSLIFFIVNGILDRVVEYNGDMKWKNSKVNGITIGNLEGKAGIKIYSIRIYNRALTLNEELTNFIADSDNLLAKYNENDIYVSGTETVSLDLLKRRIPTMVWYGEREQFDKTDNKSNNWQWDVEFYDPQTPELDFFARAAWFSNQGTSSMRYPKRNVRMYFGKTFNKKTKDTEAKYWTEVYLSGEFTHGQTNDPTTLGNFYCNKKTAADGYHKLYNIKQAELLESRGDQLFFKHTDDNYYPCSFNDGSTTEYYVALQRPLKDWKMTKKMRYSGVTLYSIDGYSTVVNPVTEQEYQVAVFKKLKGKNALKEGTQYYIDQAQWQQSLEAGYTNRWTIKADYAESSNCHNGGIARLWGNAMKNVKVDGDFKCRTNAQIAMGKYADGVDIRTSCDGKPIVGFHAPLDYDADGKIQYDENGFRKYKEAEFVGMYNIMTDKGSTPLFGFEDIYDENGEKIFDASKVECWEGSNNGTLFGQGVDLITDTDPANAFMGTRFVFSDFEPRWPDVELTGPDEEDYLVAHTHNLESLWRFVHFCKPGLIYQVDGRDGYTLSEYIELDESEYESIAASNGSIVVYIKIDDSGNEKWEELPYKSIDDLYNAGKIYKKGSEINYNNILKKLSDETITGNILIGRAASSDVEFGVYVEDIAFDDEKVDTGRVDYGQAIKGSEFEEDYYVNVYLTQRGNKYVYTDQYGKEKEYVGSVDRDNYEKNAKGESYAGKTYIEYFSDKKYDHFDVNRLAAYYIYVMRFAAVDQVIKNTMLTTEDGIHYYYINYDNDTTLGVRNDGHIVYHWNVDRNTYDYGVSQFAFAGPKSVLWNLLEFDTDFMNVVKKVDNAFYNSKVLSGDIAIDFFDNKHSNIWSERIYNENEEYKYLPSWTEAANPEYLNFVHGSRRQHRTWFIKNRFNLYDAKWKSGEYASLRIVFFMGITSASATNEVEMFKLTAARQNVFALTNSDLNDAADPFPANWTAELGIDETFTFKTTSNWNGVSSPFYLVGIDKIKELDFRPAIEAGHSFNNIGFDDGNTDWVNKKGTLLTKFLIGYSDEYREGQMLRIINESGSTVEFIDGDNAVSLAPGEYYDTVNNINPPAGCNGQVLKGTKSTFKSITQMEILNALEEIDVRNVFDGSGGIQKISTLYNLHKYRAIGSSIKAFEPALGVTLSEVSLPGYDLYHEGLNSLILNNTTFKKEEGQEADVFKYTPDSALRIVTFKNVNGFTQDIVGTTIDKFVTTWYEANKSNLSNCVLSLEGINLTDVHVSFVTDILPNMTVTNLTGRIELVGSNNGALTQEEYEKIVELYGVDVFNPQSSLVFSAPESQFWTIDEKFGNDVIATLPGVGQNVEVLTGVNNITYKIKSTVLPVETTDKIEYLISVNKNDKFETGKFNTQRTQCTADNVTISFNPNEQYATLSVNLNQVSYNKDRIIRINTYKNGENVRFGTPLYISLKEAKKPVSLDLYEGNEKIGNSIEFVSNKKRTFGIGFNGEYNVDVKNINVKFNETLVNNATVENIRFDEESNKYLFDVTPTINNTTLVGELGIDVEFDLTINNKVETLSIKKSCQITTIKPTGYDLYMMDSNGEYVKCPVKDVIELYSLGIFNFAIRQVDSVSNLTPNVYPESIEINTDDASSFTITTINNDVTFNEELIQWEFNIEVSGATTDFNEEFELPITLNYPVEYNIESISATYSFDSSIILPNDIRLLEINEFANGEEIDPNMYFTYPSDENGYYEIAKDNKITFEPYNTVHPSEGLTVDYKLTLVSYEAYRFENEEKVIDETVNNLLEAVNYDSKNPKITININKQQAINIVYIDLKFKFEYDGQEKELVKTITINRTFASYRSIIDLLDDTNNDTLGFYLMDDDNNIYDVFTNESNETAQLNDTLAALIDETDSIVTKINTLIYVYNYDCGVGTELGKNRGYVAIPLFGNSEIFSNVRTMPYLPQGNSEIFKLVFNYYTISKSTMDTNEIITYLTEDYVNAFKNSGKSEIIIESTPLIKALYNINYNITAGKNFYNDTGLKYNLYKNYLLFNGLFEGNWINLNNLKSSYGNNISVYDTNAIKNIKLSLTENSLFEETYNYFEKYINGIETDYYTLQFNRKCTIGSIPQIEKFIDQIGNIETYINCVLEELLEVDTKYNFVTVFKSWFTSNNITFTNHDIPTVQIENTGSTDPMINSGNDFGFFIYKGMKYSTTNSIYIDDQTSPDTFKFNTYDKNTGYRTQNMTIPFVQVY